MKKILIIISLIISIIGGITWYKKSSVNTYAKNFGNISVNFHSVLPGEAIFDIKNFLPGDRQTRVIDIKNTGDKKIEVFIDGDKVSGSSGNPKIEEVLNIKIEQNGSTLYSKKLNDFFSSGHLTLGEIQKGKSKQYKIVTSFPSESGNIYQNKSVKFDLNFPNNSEDQKDDKDKDDKKNKKDKDKDDHDNRSWRSFLNKLFKFFKR